MAFSFFAVPLLNELLASNQTKRFMNSLPLPGAPSAIRMRLRGPRQGPECVARAQGRFCTWYLVHQKGKLAFSTSFVVHHQVKQLVQW